MGQCAAFNPEHDRWNVLETVDSLARSINQQELRGPDLHPLQYGIFNAYTVGETYKWHNDIVVQKDGRERFLSCVVVLSDPGSYQCIDDRSGFEINSPVAMPTQNQGDVIVFPSGFVHRATEIVSGFRYSLAMWAAKEQI